jgi:DinB superfamily
MLDRPKPEEAAPYYFKYIDLVASGDIVSALETQLQETTAFLATISEEKSLHRYAPDKWTIREVLRHVIDGERVFAFRAFWFARGSADPLPGFEQDDFVKTSGADEIDWASHVEEFQRVRLSNISFFRNLPAEAWSREGIASDNPFTVRAIAYILAGHVNHHLSVIKQHYL